MYNPSALIDAMIQRLQVKNDAKLCALLGVSPPVISKVRNGKLPVGASLLIRMHEVSNLTIKELRDLMGDRRERFRVGSGKKGESK